MDTPSVFAMIVDGLILVLLGITAFFAARLSLRLKDFRDGRTEMDSLVRRLSQEVANAERAIEGLRTATRDSGRDLQQTINEAKALSDELQIMSQSGGSLASRLEKLADRKTGSRYRAPVPSPASFAIRDPDFDQGLDSVAEAEADDAKDFYAEEDGGDRPDFGSRAERELYEALRGGRAAKKAGAGGWQ